MAAATTRRKAAKLVASEASAAFGTLQTLPAAVPTAVEPDHSLPTAAAMMAEDGSKPAWGSSGAGKGNVSDLASSVAEALSASGAGTSTGRPGDPDLAYAFNVIINSVTYATFAEIGGLSWKAEAIPVRSGGNNEYGYNMRGPGKFEPLTLKRGQFAANGEFYDMMKASLSGSCKGSGLGADRVNLTITLLNRKYQKIGEYRVFKAFITEYSGLALNAMSSQVGFEQIRLAYDYFEYKKG